MSGEPHTLIEGIPLEEAYYEATHSVIVDHYNDPLKRISRHIDALQSCTAMTVDKKQTLRNIMSTFRAHVTGLQIVFQEHNDNSPDPIILAKEHIQCATFAFERL